MHRISLIFSFTIALLGWTLSSHAMIRKPKPKALTANIGFTNITFDGVNNSDFSAFNHFHLDFSFLRYPKLKWYRYGLGVNVTPDLAFKNVVWSNGTSGNYLVSLQNIYFNFGGYFKKRFLWAVLYGYETVSFRGSPSAGAGKLNYFTPGFEFGFFWKQEGKLYFPIFLRYWQKPSRTIAFSNYPNDTMTAQPGHAIEVDIGVQYGF